MQQIIRIILICVVSLCLFSCGGSPSVRTTAGAADISAQKKADRLNDALMLNAGVMAAGGEDSYLIGSEDVLEIEAYNVEELKKTVRVNSQGEIALPLVGILQVKGLTTSEAEQMIARKLDKYVEETVVTVFVKEYKSQRISVVGAVKNPQVFSVTGQRTLIEMLMMAGGLEKEAGAICYVIRPTLKTNPVGRSETIVINLDDLLMSGDFSLNIPVFAGDVVNVPKGGIFFVDGAVKMPGVYTMKGRTSLVQALAMAQGVTSLALLDDVRIFRDNGRGEREIIVADYDAIRDGTKQDIFLSENDIVIVPVSGTKNFFNNFISTIKGFISFGTYAL